MPILEDHPAWSSLISALVGGYGTFQQAKNDKAERERQAKIDAQNAALTQAQLQNYAGLEKSRAATEAKTGAETNILEGSDPLTGKRPVIPKGLSQVVPGAGKKKRAVTPQQYVDHYNQLGNFYAGHGLLKQAADAYAQAKLYEGRGEKEQSLETQKEIAKQRAIAAATLEKQRFGERVALKGIPQARAPGVGRGGNGRGAAEVDADTATQAEAAIQKSSDPQATAENIASQVELHGGKSAYKTSAYIRLRGAYWSRKHKPKAVNPLLQP